MKKVLSKYTLILLLALPLAFYMSCVYPSPEKSSRKAISTEREQTSLPVKSSIQTRNHSKENADKVKHGHEDPIAPILLGIVIILAAAKIGGGIFEKISQPAVLGELVLGIIIGNLAYFTGWEFFAPLRNHTFIDLLARFGVLILLFEIGLGTDIRDMVRVGLSSLLVALGGVMAPFILGYFTSLYFFPDAGFSVHLFVGATLSATSVGIKARVFRDLGKLQTTESSIVMGAAVFDDIIVLFILAVVTDIVVTGSVDPFPVIQTSIFSILFLVGAIFMGLKLAETGSASWLLHDTYEGRGLEAGHGYCFLSPSLLYSKSYRPGNHSRRLCRRTDFKGGPFQGFKRRRTRHAGDFATGVFCLRSRILSLNRYADKAGAFFRCACFESFHGNNTGSHYW